MPRSRASWADQDVPSCLTSTVEQHCTGSSRARALLRPRGGLGTTSVRGVHSTWGKAEQAEDVEVACFDEQDASGQRLRKRADTDTARCRQR
jgi:hypothetical protein